MKADSQHNLGVEESVDEHHGELGADVWKTGLDGWGLSESVEVSKASRANDQPEFSGPPRLCTPAEMESTLIYRGPTRGEYQIPDDNGGWTSGSEAEVRRRLKMLGFQATGKHERVSQIDRVLNYLTKARNVQFAGPLAGHRKGPQIMNGFCVLVTTEPDFVVPIPGPCHLLQKFFADLLGEEQVTSFYGWLAFALRALVSGECRPGQALAIAGAPGAGKTFTSKIITQLLGGRVTDPYMTMRGGSEFNGHLFGSEVLLIDDGLAHPDATTRRMISTAIKQSCAAAHHQCHPKNQPAITLKAYRRVLIMLNDEPTSITVLPPLKIGVEDKLMILRAKKAFFPFPNDSEEERKTVDNAWQAEIPAFANWLMHEFKLPEELKDSRYGVKAYHNPHLAIELAQHDESTMLLELIDLICPWEGGNPGGSGAQWCGSATELERKLRAWDGIKELASRLFRYTGACGGLLTELAKKHPERVTCESRKKTGNRYTIFRGGSEESNSVALPLTKSCSRTRSAFKPGAGVPG